MSLIKPSPEAAEHTAWFISHGSPMTALGGGPAGTFMRELGTQWRQAGRRPKAIIGVSAHTLTPAHNGALLAAPRHEAVYDFGGFDPALRTLRYDAPGAPELAHDVAMVLNEAGWTVQQGPWGGLDHGLWTPLRFLWPAADIPILPMAWNPRTSPADLLKLGTLLSRFAAQGVWLLASGSITHNLGLFARHQFPMEAPEIEESRAFRQWWRSRAEAADWPALCDYREQAPHAVAMHPTDEHLLPFFVAAGWGQALRGSGGGGNAQRLHESAQHGVIGMDAYGF
jgi:4,5-DOPA dioxygenase extradiol